MLITIDCREQYLIQEFRRYVSGKKELAEIKLEIKSLPIGDAIISSDDGDEKLIIERKTMNDLASSIRDGRYNEQSFRLDACNLPNHNIIYLIEGTFMSIGPRFEKKTILSAITSLFYHKGFSVYRTHSVAESAEWLIRVADKIRRESKPPYYVNPSAVLECSTENTIKSDVTVSTGNTSNDYTSVCKRVKKDNITVDNIGKILLIQIPGVSLQVATVVMDELKTIKNLIETLDKDPTALDNLTTTTKTGKERKIPKPARQNIYNYLVSNNNGMINVQT